MTCGIYKITNVLDNKCIVGQSVDINKRWNRHKMDLRLNKHGNKYLQNSYNKYGKDSFKFEIIKGCLREDLNNLEIFYIKEYKSFWKDGCGYNMTTGGDSVSGVGHHLYGIKRPKFSKEWIKNMSLANLGKHNSPKSEFKKGDIPSNIKSIIQYDKEGNFIKEWNSIIDASRELKIKTTHIWGVLNNYDRRKTAGGFKFKYKNKENIV